MDGVRGVVAPKRRAPRTELFQSRMEDGINAPGHAQVPTDTPDETLEQFLQAVPEDVLPDTDVPRLLGEVFSDLDPVVSRSLLLPPPRAVPECAERCFLCLGFLFKFDRDLFWSPPI